MDRFAARLRRRFLILLAVAASAVSPAFAVHAQAPISAPDQALLDRAVARGRLLFELDRAAWVGTDDMMANLPDFRSIGLSGYIVERDGDAYSVIFYGGPAAAPVAYYRGRVESRRVVSREVFAATDRPALTPLQRRLAAARDAANRLGRRPCGDRPFNTVVVPPEAADAPIELYLLTPQVRNGEFPMGGHYRAVINADGSVGETQEFMRSCMTMTSRPDAVGIVVTHLLGPVPTELHVFTSLTSRMLVFVTIDGRLFRVDGASPIQLVERPAPKT